MLVLGRMVKERIQIGSDVIVTIVGVSGKKVRVGVEAPEEISVIRLEPKELELRRKEIEVRRDVELSK